MGLVKFGKQTGKFLLGLGISFLIFLGVFIILSLLIFSLLFWFQGYLSDFVTTLIFFVITSIVFVTINFNFQNLFKDIYIRRGIKIGYLFIILIYIMNFYA